MSLQQGMMLCHGASCSAGPTFAVPVPWPTAGSQLPLLLGSGAALAQQTTAVGGAAPEALEEEHRSVVLQHVAAAATAAAALAATADLRHRRQRRQQRRPLLASGGFSGRGRVVAAASAAPAEEPKVGSSGAKWRTFWACFFGYAVCYFTRQSLSYTAPVLKKAMGWEGLAQLGQLSSIFPLAYGSSRFLGGVLGDRMSPRKVFALGLGVCGGLNVAFGLSSTLPMFALFWFLNGCFQGLVAPPCVKMITNWFDPKERGLWWSVWHASINLGGFLIPFLAGGLAQTYGWRYGMLGPGSLAMGMAALCLLLMRDGPEEAAKPSPTAQGDAEAAEGGTKKPAKEETAEEKVGIVDGLLKSPQQWALGVAYLLVYIVRQGLLMWGIFYLLHQGVASAAKAAALFSGFELGGFLGNLTAGAASDWLLRRAKPGDGEPGQRAKVVCFYFLSTLFLVPAFARCPASLPGLQYVLLLCIGHFLSGSQLLLPLVAAEVAPTSLTATATGFIGWVGYFGAAMAGLPLSYTVEHLGWSCYFSVLTTAAGLGTVLLLPLRNLRSWKQRQAAAKAAA